MRRAAQTALAAEFTPVIVVLGAMSDQIKPSLAQLAVEIIENTEWERGMGTSIRAGMAHLMRTVPMPDAVVLMVCDQPLIEARHVAQLVGVHLKTGKGMVGASYEGTVGVPALIGRKYFSELANIGDAGGGGGEIAFGPVR